MVQIDYRTVAGLNALLSSNFEENIFAYLQIFPTPISPTKNLDRQQVVVGWSVGTLA